MKIEFETVGCCVCGSRENTSWLSGLKDRWFFHEGSFTMVRCNQCRHIYQNPRPTLGTLHLCYPPEYQPYHSLKKGITGWLKSCVLDREVSECASFKAPPGRILEIGCAHGDFLERLKARGFEVSGVEFDEGTSEQARRRGLDVKTGTLRQAALPSSHFDIVYMKHVIEHLPDVRETLQEIHRILKPGGHLLIATPNVDCTLVNVFGADTFDLEIPRHLNLFSCESLEKQLKGDGFDVISVKHDLVPNSWIHSCRLKWEKSALAKTFFCLENPLALLLFAPLSMILALFKRSSRIRVWSKRL